MSRRWCTCSALLVGGALLVAAADAQAPRRPKLEADQDTNDWGAYYDYGVRHLTRFPARAHAAFYWAARLAPWSGDPMYAQWVAFHLRDIGRFERYLDDDERVKTRPEVMQADSLASHAYLRNPFIHQAIEMALYDALPGRWKTDLLTRAWLAYASQQLKKANELFGRAITQSPDKHFRQRHVRAVLFVTSMEYDSALTEVTALLERARRLDEELLRSYESKAFYEYAIGRLHIARGDTTKAREALERALIEDLSYAPAHMWLGTLADPRGELTLALPAYAQAVEIAPDDAIYRYQHAAALLKSGQSEQALSQITRAAELEPWYAELYVLKATAQERLAQRDSARVTYQTYLARAPRNAENRAFATRRLAELSATSPSP